jgi:hypothetical protein
MGSGPAALNNTLSASPGGVGFTSTNAGDEREQQKQGQQSGWTLLYSCSSSSSEGKLSLVFTSQLYGLKLSTYWFQRAKGLVHQVVVRFRTLLLG